MDDRIIPPYKGVSNNTAYYNTKAPYAPPEAIDNVLTFDVAKDRPRMGTRPGLEEFFAGTFGNGQPVQGCGVVARSRTPSGYVVGAGVDIAGTDGASHNQPAVTGQIWDLDRAWGLFNYRYEDVTASRPVPEGGPDTGPSTNAVGAIGFNPAKTLKITATSYVDASAFMVVRVTCTNAATGAFVWSKKISEAGVNRFVNSVCVHDEWVFVCTNDRIRIYTLSNGADPAIGANFHNCNGWADEVVACCLSEDKNTLYALIIGTSAGATLPSGAVVTAGKYARHFRSGIFKMIIASASSNLPMYGAVLTQTPYSAQITPADRYYESTPPHNYLRFSEKMPWKPRGCIPTAFQRMPDGGFLVTHGNSGWGPNGTPANTDYRAPDGSAGYWTLSRFNVDGVFLWRADTESILEFGDGGFQNDLLDPSIKAVCVDDDGNVYAGGRRTIAVGSPDGRNTFGFDVDGLFLWDGDLGNTVVREGAMAVVNGLVVVGGDRTDDWIDASGSASGEFAQLWELRPTDGVVTRFHEVGPVSTLGVAAGNDGGVSFVTDKV